MTATAPNPAPPPDTRPEASAAGRLAPSTCGDGPPSFHSGDRAATLSRPESGDGAAVGDAEPAGDAPG